MTSLNVVIKNVASGAREKLLDLIVNVLPACQSEEDRRIRLLQYCTEHRALYLKLMALVEFVGQKIGTGSSSSSSSSSTTTTTTTTTALAREFSAIVKNTTALMEHVKQRRSYIETTTQLLDEVHQKQSSSVVPPYETRTAIDVLATGKYTHLPAFPMRNLPALRRSVLGWEPPTSEIVLEDLNRRLRHRVSQSSAAERFTNVVVTNGRAIIFQESEFRIELTLENDNWRVLHTDCLVGETRNCISLHAQPKSIEIVPVVKRLLETVPRPNPKTLKQLWDNMKYVLTEAQKMHPDWNIDISHIYEMRSKMQLQSKIVAELSKSNVTLDDSLLKIYHVAHQHCYMQARNILHRQAEMNASLAVSSTANGIAIQYWRATLTRPTCSVLIGISQSKQQLTISHSPILTTTASSTATAMEIEDVIDTTKLNITHIVNDAKCAQASIMLTKAWDALIETLPWFLTPSDVRLTWEHSRATSLKVSINAGAMDFVLLVDMPTGHYRCSMVVNTASPEKHAPLFKLIAACPMHDIEKRMNNQNQNSKSRSSSSSSSSSNSGISNGRNRSGVNHGLGVTLASVLIQIQASIINTELAHAAEQAGFVEISPKLIVQKDESDTISSARGVWNSENTTIFAKENESKLYCVCVGAGSDADTTIRRRYLWPPICEIIQTIAPVTFSKALGPFRSSIQISFETKNVTVVVNKQTGKRKRENNDTGMVNTVDTNQAVQMLQMLCR